MILSMLTLRLIEDPVRTSSLGHRSHWHWNRVALAEIIATDPDLVITAATREVRVGLTENTPPDFVDRWSLLDRHGIPVLAGRDTGPGLASVPARIWP